MTTIRSHSLEGDKVQPFINRLLAILRAARLNNQYPDARRLSAHARAMGPDVHGGEYDELQVNLDSGLPTYREWTRVQTDVSIAADQLKTLGDRRELARRAASSDHDIHRRQLAKYDYYDAITNLPLAPLGAMDVTLRRIVPAENTAHFRITFDKLDASGIFIRNDILLSQRDQAWNTRIVEIDDENSSHTDEFQSLIYRFSSMDAEFTFAKLAGLPGVTVQGVSRGTVGPIYYGGGEAPAPFDQLVGDDPDRFVGVFAIDRAADDVRENRNNDPIGHLFTDELSQKMRPTYGAAREKFGYRVYRDRKFVVSRGLEGPLREICEAQGTRNIIYTI